MKSDKTNVKTIKDLPDLEISDYLRNEEDIAEFLTSITSDPESSAEELVAAIGHVAKARGISKVAEDAGLQRESVYKILRQGSKPQFSSVYSILKSLGVHLVAEPNAVYEVKSSEVKRAGKRTTKKHVNK